MNTLKFWSVFAVGVAAGAIVALIYAPQSGVKTRRQIKRKFDDATDYISDATDTLGEHAAKAIKQGKGFANDVVSSATSAANAAARQVSSLV
jgi:gas vesicle protein